MRVKHLSLFQFRNYHRLELDFAPGKVLILGRNGQGKTNLAEAIAYFNALVSHRVSSDAPLFLHGTKQTVIRLKVQHGAMSPTLELELKLRGVKKAQINGTSVKPRELTRWLSTVVFAPEDLQIVRGDPSARRAFLDEAIVTRNPYFVSVFKDYERIVKQRTALLKSLRHTATPEYAADALAFWDTQLIDCGTRIMAERRKLVDELLPHLRSAYAQLVEADHNPQLQLKETATISGGGYSPQSVVNLSVSAVNEAVNPEKIIDSVVFTPQDHLSNVSRETLTENFKTALQHYARAEMERGMTLVGPHRDDLEISLNNLPVKGYASHGEGWSVALALKLGFAKILQHEFAPEDPVLILDDVFAELDAARRARLMQAVSDYEQVIVTAAVAEDIPAGDLWQVHIIHSGAVVHSAQTTNPAEIFAAHGQGDHDGR